MPGFTETVDPKLAVPETVGLVVIVGDWFVTDVTTDQRAVFPDPLCWMVLTVIKLPASAATCVYVVEVAPLISTH